MEINYLHSFDVTYGEALAIQKSLRERLILHDDCHLPPKIIAGADISYAKNSDLFFAAVILHSYPEMKIIEETYASQRSVFPYIPGLLTFREGPALLKAFAELRQVPDLVIFDGQGIAHPRGVGLASHMGLFLNVPTIGCAKSRLTGSHREVGKAAGKRTPLLHDNETIGSVVRTKTGIKPLFISPGHRISLQQSIDVVLSCCRGYRLPEAVRNAHLAVNRFRQKYLEGKNNDLVKSRHYRPQTIS
jgi:deoxyribonuclease V